MVISDVYRYVFIEVPQTASTALADELVKNYQGRRILRKHTDYSAFLRTASQDECRYAVVAAVRNPLDIVLSKFIKARDDHRNVYHAKSMEGAPWGYRFRPEAREFSFISRNRADFSAYVRKFYPRVYNSRACLLPDHARVIRYEQLNDDLAVWFRSIGIDMLRAIPWRHTTDGRDRKFSEYFTGDLRSHAAHVFGPYMRKWGYEFPSDWPDPGSSGASDLAFRLDTAMRRFYFRNIHYGWVMPRARRN